MNYQVSPSDIQSPQSLREPNVRETYKANQCARGQILDWFPSPIKNETIDGIDSLFLATC